MALGLGATATFDTSIAQARDMTGKASVGALVTSTGMPMLALRYWRTRMALEFLAGWRSHRDELPTVTLQDGNRVTTAGAALASSELVSECKTLASASELAKQSGARSVCAATLELSTLRLALGMLVRVGDGPRASLAIGVRPWVQLGTQTLKLTRTTALGKESDTGDGNKVNSLDALWGLDIPLQAEAFLSDHVSIHGHVALSLGYGGLPNGSDSGILQGASGLWMGTGGSFSGGGGFSYYF